VVFRMNLLAVCIRQSILLILSLLITVPLSYAQAPASSPPKNLDLDAMNKELKALSHNLQALRGEIDQTQFDPEQLLDTLDFEADAAVAFVGTNVAFQPYGGVLRGVRGTLQAAAGNSLDQSLLLGYLLNTAGYEARITQATLTDEDAQRLVLSLGPGRAAGNLDHLEAAVTKMFPGAGAQQTEPWPPQALLDSASSTSRMLQTELEKAGHTLKSANVTSQLVRLSKPYYWVQYRDGPSQDWQDAHPAFGASSAPQVTPSQYFKDTVPAELNHTLTVAAFAEQNHAGKIVKHSLMNPWTKPVANLHGRVIRYRNSPNGLNLSTMGNLSEAIKNSQILTPMFNDSRPKGGMAFDLKGRAIDPMLVTSGSGGAAGLFTTLGDALEQAAVSTSGSKEPLLYLRSMWLEFTITTPSGQQKTHRRYVLPPADATEALLDERFWALLTDHLYMVNSGHLPAEYLADRYLDTGDQNSIWFELTVRKYLQPEVKLVLPEDTLSVDFAPLAQYWLMQQHQTREPGTITFRSAPGLLGLRRGFHSDTTAFAGVDIVTNPVEHLAVEDNQVNTQPLESLSRGVWDTALETTPNRVLAVSAASSVNTIQIFEKSTAQGIDLAVLSANNQQSLTAIEMDANTRQFVMADINHGYTLLIPRQKPEGEAMLGWWRVNPDTGETLGMTADGYGQDMVEYLTQQVGNAFTVIPALQYFKDCDKNKRDADKLCCLVDAHINNVAGLGFGGLMGGALGSAGSALFTVVDYGTKLATEKLFDTSQGLMPQTGMMCNAMK
jgi:hypothetical protein